MDNNNPNNTKPAHSLVERTFQALQKEYVVVGRTHVRSWQAWLVIGIVVGITTGVILVANRSGEFETGLAAETAEINQLIAVGEKDYEILLNIPNYLPEFLSRPNKFFSGRPIKIVKKNTETTFYPTSISLTNRDKATKALISKQSLEVKKSRQNYFVVDIPENASTGFYTVELIADNEKFYLPIEIIGLTAVEKAQLVPIKTIDSSILRLDCETCFWESVSGINPIDENYGYFVGGYYYYYLVQTIDAWNTSETHRIDNLTVPPPERKFRGDPKLVFTEDNRLTIASLLVKSEEPITGGIYQDSAKKNHPPQFKQTLLSEIPPDLDPSIWLIFDYEKISIDTYPESDYFQNIYVFANAVWFNEIGHSQGLFIIDSVGNISRKNRGYGSAISSTVVGPGGVLYAARPSFYVGYPIGELFVSYDGGNSFETRNITKINNPISNCAGRVSTISNRAWFIYRGPEIAVNKDGVIYATWASQKECIEDPNFEYSKYGYDYDVYVSSSNDNGITWSEPVRVNDDNSGGDQGFPSITVGEDGTIYVAFLDHREDQDKAEFDVYIAESTNGGLSFSKNMQINDVSVPNVNGYRDPGDYLDMVSVGDTKIYVSHPCVNFNYPQYGRPSDGCVSTFQKPLIITKSIITSDVAQGSYELGNKAKSNMLQQSFKVLGSSIPKVSVALSNKNNPEYPIKVSIREEVDGPDLVSTYITPSPLSTNHKDPTWVDVFFNESFAATSGKTYYLTLSVSDFSRENFYRWSINRRNSYADGKFYFRTKAKKRYDALAKIYYGE